MAIIGNFRPPTPVGHIWLYSFPTSLGHLSCEYEPVWSLGVPEVPPAPHETINEKIERPRKTEHLNLTLLKISQQDPN